MAKDDEVAPAAPVVAPEPTPGEVKPESGKVKLNIKTSQEVVEVEPSETVETAVPVAATVAATPAAPVESAKPDPLKPWRMSDGKLDEAKVAKDREDITPWIMAGQEAVALFNEDPDVKRAVLAAQKKRGRQLTAEEEAVIVPPAPAVKPRTEEDVRKEYLNLYRSGKPDDIRKAEDLWMDWRLDQRFGPKIAEAEKQAAEGKAYRESQEKDRIARAESIQMAKEWGAAAKKYDGILKMSNGEPEWLDKAVADIFIPLATKYPQESVDELMSWTLAKLGRLQVEPEPNTAPRPRIQTRTAAAPVTDKKQRDEEARKDGKVTLKISKQVDVLEED